MAASSLVVMFAVVMLGVVMRVGGRSRLVIGEAAAPLVLLGCEPAAVF